MTGNLLLDSVISLAAIGLMVFAAWIAFRKPPAPVSEASATERLSFDEPDFEPVAWLMDDKGKAALAEGRDGDYALVSRLGIDLVTRRFKAGQLHASMNDSVVVIFPGDPGSRAVHLLNDKAAEWARKLGIVTGR